MPIINIVISQEEKNKMLVVISKHKETISVNALAKEAGYNPNRARFIVDEMLQEGTIRRVATKDFGPKCVRYRYEITGK